MQELTTLETLVTKLGIPVLVCLVIIYGAVKLVPTWIETWKQSKEADRKRLDQEWKSQQAYYDDRNKSYQQQLEVMNSQAEHQNNLIGQATQVIARSNEVIAANTEAMKQTTRMHQKVIESLERDMEATREIATLIKDHDKRAEKIYTIAIRNHDKIDYISS